VNVSAYSRIAEWRLGLTRDEVRSAVTGGEPLWSLVYDPMIFGLNTHATKVRTEAGGSRERLQRDALIHRSVGIGLWHDCRTAAR
jgi:hypothetical protein